MKRFINNGIKVGMVGAMALTSGVGAALAADYTPVPGGQTSFQKYLIVNKGSKAPVATFKFVVTPGEAIKGTAEGKGTFNILAGVGTPTIADVVFNADNEVFDTVQGEDAVTLAEGKAYAKQTATIDFSKCNFTEPGVYRYIVTESGTNPGVTNDAKTERVMDVFVNDDNGELKVAGYVMHNDKTAIDIQDAQAKLGDKSAGFTNVYESADLIMGKEVTGNQGNKHKHFKFTLKITGAPANAKFAIDYTGADKAAQPKAADGQEADSLVVGADGTVTRDFMLKDGERIAVKGLTPGAKYELTEDADGYKSTEGITIDVTNNEDQLLDATSGTVGVKPIRTGFTNDKEGVIPTGLLIDGAPYIAIALAGGAFVVLAKRKKANQAE